MMSQKLGTMEELRIPTRRVYVMQITTKEFGLQLDLDLDEDLKSKEPKGG